MGENNQEMLMFITIICFLSPTLMQVGYATQFKVGGENWSVPNDTSNTDGYNKWAERYRFQVGDTLLFVYNASEDSVLQVKEEDYRSCKTSEAIASFSDGYTVFNLSRSGAFFFISGKSDRCNKSEKLHVVVMAIRGSHASVSASPAPAPSRSSSPAPAPSPISASSAPAPSPEASPPTTAAASPLFQSNGGVISALSAILLSLVFM